MRKSSGKEPTTAYERRQAMYGDENKQGHPFQAVFAIIMLLLMLAPIVLNVVGKFN